MHGLTHLENTRLAVITPANNCVLYKEKAYEEYRRLFMCIKRLLGPDFDKILCIQQYVLRIRMCLHVTNDGNMPTVCS
jgi:hypothetical protein